MLFLTDNEKKLCTILSDKNWYSYSIKFIKRKIFIDENELSVICKKLENKIGDKINFFYYNNIQYVGLESRRLDYERDKKNGTNKVEKLIAKGVYE